MGSSCFSFPIYIYIYISAASSLFVVVVVVAHFLQVFVVFRFGEENAGYKNYATIYLLTAPSSLLLFEKVLETLLRKSLGYGCKWLCFFFLSEWKEPEEIGTWVMMNLGYGFLGCFVFFMSDWRRAEEIGNSGYEELWVMGLGCVVVFMADWRRAEEIGNSGYEELWVVGLGCVVVFMSDWRRAHAIWIGVMVESNWFWGMKNRVKFVIVCAIVIISFQYVFQCGHVVHTNFEIVDNEL